MFFFLYPLQLSSEFRTSACVALPGHCNQAPAITGSPSRDCFPKCAKLNIHTSQVANLCCIYWKAVTEPYSSDCWKSFLLQASSTSVLILVIYLEIDPAYAIFGVRWNSFFDPFLSDGVSRLEFFWGAAVWQSICPCMYHSVSVQYISYLCRLKYTSWFKSVILL